MNSFAEATSGDVEDGAGESAPGELDDAIDLPESGPVEPQRQSNEDDEETEETVGLDASALVDRLADGSVEEIDGLIAALEMLRDQLYAEGRRVQSEVSVFARVGDSAMQTTMVIGKALGQWRSSTGRGA